MSTGLPAIILARNRYLDVDIAAKGHVAHVSSHASTKLGLNSDGQKDRCPNDRKKGRAEGRAQPRPTRQARCGTLTMRFNSVLSAMVPHRVYASIMRVDGRSTWPLDPKGVHVSPNDVTSSDWAWDWWVRRRGEGLKKKPPMTRT